MIEQYSFGRIKIDGRTYTSDVIIYPDRVDDGWWRKEGHSLCMDDLDEILAAKPEALIVGTGAYGAMQVPLELQRQVAQRGVEFKVCPTPQACAAYNQLAPKRKTIAALHLTC